MRKSPPLHFAERKQGQGISKIFSSFDTFLDLITLEKFKITLEQIFLTVGQDNYGNRIFFNFSRVIRSRKVSKDENIFDIPCPCLRSAKSIRGISLEKERNQN
jgi:hypothetical protein